jgi:hypothetical protein
MLECMLHTFLHIEVRMFSRNTCSGKFSFGQIWNPCKIFLLMPYRTCKNCFHFAFYKGSNGIFGGGKEKERVKVRSDENGSARRVTWSTGIWNGGSNSCYPFRTFRKMSRVLL